jgi:hypothetical protein
MLSRCSSSILGMLSLAMFSACIDTSSLVFDRGSSASSSSGSGGAGASGGGGNGGSAGASPACDKTFVHPAASSLSDDFSRGASDPEWSPTGPDGCQSLTGGELVSIAGTGYCRFFTSRTFHLTCDSVMFKVPQPASLELGVQTYVYVTSGANQFTVLLGPGFNIGGFDVTDDTYSPTADLWWRLTENGGTLTFETSREGSSWHEKGHGKTPFDFDAIAIELGSGIWKPSITDGGEAHFDCYNVPDASCH